MLLQLSTIADCSPDPLLAAFDNYRGTITDLDSGHCASARDLAQARAACEAQLVSCGYGNGHCAVMAVGNGPLFLVTLTALLSRGISPLLLHAKTPVAELKRTAQQYGVRFVISDSCSETDLRSLNFEPWAIDCGSCGHLVVAESVEAIHREYAFDGQLSPVPLHPTSGSTGTPKLAIRPARAAISEALHYIETAGLDSRDTILVAPPMSHAYCFGMGVMVPLLSGANIVSMRAFSAGLVRSALASRTVTVVPAAPAMLASLMFGSPANLFAGVRDVFTAGSPLSEKLAVALRERFHVAVRPLYGTTETGGIAISAAGSDAVAGACVGPPMRGVQVQVQGQVGNAEGVGKLFVRSESMMAGYLGADGTVTTPLVDGWFETGDLASLDDARRIHLRGRQSEVINVAGMKVIPVEVEDVIGSMTGVVEVKVYGREHRSGSNVVCAAVALEPGTTVDDVRAHCEKNLVYYKRPDKVLVVEALPRSPTGKIVRDLLP